MTSLHADIHGRIRSGPRAAWMPFAGEQVATVVDAHGPEMDRSETVTVFNDLVVLAPGAIIDAPVHWTAVDADHVRGTYTSGGQRVAAILAFNAQHDLVDFGPVPCLCRRQILRQAGVVDTPHRLARLRRVPARHTGEGLWSAPQPEGAFTYPEFHLDDIRFNVHGATSAAVAVSR